MRTVFGNKWTHSQVVSMEFHGILLSEQKVEEMSDSVMAKVS